MAEANTEEEGSNHGTDSQEPSYEVLGHVTTISRARIA
jgi:hypothetical protein